MSTVVHPWIRQLTSIVCGVVWIAAAVATHLPVETYAGIHASDNTLHFFGYLVLGIVVLLTLRFHELALPRRFWGGIVVLLVYAAVDELTQPLVGRHAGWSDWLANASGVLAAGILDLLLSRAHPALAWPQTRAKQN